MSMIINISYHQRQDCHDITKILLKVALSTIKPTPQRQVADTTVRMKTQQLKSFSIIIQTS
jgi:hypothetical protein